ncbi:hypothetical protein LSAT2_015246 [Lamellibrachia satsuma]|nr:hypothetical protein LSAT2_015246 [Lamellibrachia satsuma]
MGEQQCSWKHTEVKKWPIQSWQLAKTCMGPGKPPSNHAPAKTDVVGLLQLIINCKAFDDPSLKQQASQIQRLSLGNGETNMFNIEDKLWSEIIYKGDGNKEAILAFVTSNEDLKERLGPKIEELRKDVEKLKDHVSNEEVRKIISRNIEQHEDIPTTVRRRKLRWYGHDTRSTSPAKTILQGTVRGKEGEAGRKKRWKQIVRLSSEVLKRPHTVTGNVRETRKPHRSAILRRRNVAFKQGTSAAMHSTNRPKAGEDSRPFKRYDIVSLVKDKKTVMKLQRGHGSWKPSMTWVLGLNGVVSKVKENGDVFVEYSNDNTYWFNPKLLEVADTSHVQIGVGDFVLVIDSARNVKALQDENHGGWNGKMRKTLGSTGTVVGTLPNGRARVFISGHRWIYNVNALRHIARSGRPASNTAPSDDSPSSDSDTETDVLFYDRTDPSLASQRDTGSRVRTQIDLGRIFCEGEKVRVDSDESVAIQLQEELVGWNDDMKQYLGKTGVVKCEQGNIVEVVFPDDQTWFINKALLQICNDDSDEEEEDQDQDRPFKKYDIVSIERDKETAEAFQEDHGGYASRMALVLGSRGYVLKVDDDGDVHVKCINQSKWCFNPKLLEVVDTSKMTIEIGDFVFVINSYATVKALQDEDHGGWQEEMRENLGVIGTVVDILPNGLANVVISEKSWIYNMKAIRHIARSDIDPTSNTTTSGDTSNSDSDSNSGMGSFQRLMTGLLKGQRSSTTGGLIDSDDDDDDDDDDVHHGRDVSLQKFGRGCQVRLDDKESRVIRLQKGHGGWHKEKIKYLGQVGVVKGKRSGDIVVQFPDGAA